jgi:hypothetical protein
MKTSRNNLDAYYFRRMNMSQTCGTEEGKCGTCGGHKAAMMMLAFVVVAALVGATSMFFGK